MKSKALVTLVVRTFVIIHRIHATSFYNNDICAMIARMVVHMHKDMFGYTFWPKCPITLSLKATSLHAFPVDDPLSLNKQENEY